MKAEIVLKSYRDGVSVADVARRHDVSAPQLHAWRRAARDGRLPMPDDDTLGLVPVLVSGDDTSRRDGGAGDSGAIEIRVGDIRIVVPSTFEPGHLAWVISAVRDAS